MTLLESLIEIYGRCDITSVPNDAEFIALSLENLKPDTRREVFEKQIARVESIKADLEQIAGIQKPGKSQLKFAVQTFHQLIGSPDEEDEICLRLIRRAYYPNWTDKQKDFFDRLVTVLKTSQDYFLSFTQRRPPGGGNPLNSDHRYLIQSVGLADPQGSDENQLACMLDRFLRISKYQFRGFFYPLHENNSRQVSQKLQEAMTNSLVFIQIVQNEMFSKQYPAVPNYCFDEYSSASADKKGMVLIFANGAHPHDMIDKLAVQPRLNAWYDFMYRADCVDLQPTRIAEQGPNVEKNRDLLKIRLVETVNELRKQLWESAPGDLE